MRRKFLAGRRAPKEVERGLVIALKRITQAVVRDRSALKQDGAGPSPALQNFRGRGKKPGRAGIVMARRGRLHPVNGQSEGETRKTWFALLALLGLSLLLRLAPNLQYPLWNDEIWRATLILDPGFWHSYFVSPSVETAITAPVYALLVKLAGLLQVSPLVLRLTSLAPGVLCAPLAFLLIRRAGGSVGLSSLAGLFFAINPNFVYAAKEMKPYSLEVCVHLACLYAWLVVVTTRAPSAHAWAIFFAVLVLAVLSSPTAIFILPAAGTSLFVRFVVEKSFRDIKICVGGFAALGALVLGLYVFEWRYGASNGMLIFWADGFHQPGQTYLNFLVSQYYGLWRAAFQTSIAIPHQAFVALIVLVIVLAWAAASGALWKRPMREFLLFCVLLAVTLCVLNAMRLWPLGPGRENLFLLAIIIVLLFLFLAQFPLSRLAAPPVWSLAIIVLLLPLTSVGGRAEYRDRLGRLGTNGVPLENSDRVIADFSYGGGVGKTIAANCTGHRTLLLLNGYMMAASRYYTQFDAAHRKAAALLGSPCVRIISFSEADNDPRQTEAVLAQSLRHNTDAWILYTNQDERQVTILRKTAQRFGQIAEEKYYANAGYFRLVIRPQPPDSSGAPGNSRSNR